jgi:hypothetical protein
MQVAARIYVLLCWQNGNMSMHYLCIVGVTDILHLFQTHCPNLQVLDLSNLRTVAHTTALLHIEKLQEGCQKLRILRITNSQIALSAATLKEQVCNQLKLSVLLSSLFMQLFLHFLYYYYYYYYHHHHYYYYCCCCCCCYLIKIQMVFTRWLWYYTQ